jgi:hypothetical protein
MLRHEDVPTVGFGFGTQPAHGTDEYTTTGALVRNATAYAILPYEYERLETGNRLSRHFGPDTRPVLLVLSDVKQLQPNLATRCPVNRETH